MDLVDKPISTLQKGSYKQLVDTNIAQRVAVESGMITESYDYVALTYVAAGNGAGEIETAIYKTGGASGTTVATLTLTYNAADEIATITRT